ncbi:hypothetical protein [uncultured Sphaerotilus sp.]|uniref:hypothetical protein n=1 Tax=uncultured Sphaerotilus sp. TaxID=474984 RepID=UPI0030CA47EA
MPARSEAPQRTTGFGTLAMVMTLLLIAHLSLLYSHRALLFEQRASAGQVRAVRAQEAAQAGIDWAVSRLNDPRALDSRCLPTAQDTAAAPAALRARWDRSLASAVALQPACVLDDAGPDWSCHCPDSGAGRVSPPAADREAPAFAVTMQNGPRTGLWSLTAEGCANPGPDCGDAGATEPDARYRVSTTLAALGQVVQAPLAALTGVGSVTIADGAGVLNTDHASGGVAIDSGSTVTVQAPAKVFGPAGQPAAAGLVADDPPLAAGSDALWRRLFGLDVAALKALPSWQVLACAGGCAGSALDTAWAQGARALWLDGDLTLANGRWGTAEAPLLLVVRGTLRIGPDAAVQGLVVADRVDVQVAASPRSLLRGGLVSLGSTVLRGPIDVVRDAAVLARAMALGGALVPVPGSWFDPHTR